MSSPRNAKHLWVIDFMRSHGAAEEAARIESCESEPLIFWDEDNRQPVLFPKHCNSRWCPVCGKIRRSQIRSRLQSIFDNHPYNELRFLTFTQRARPGESLNSALRRLKDNYRKLQTSRPWKAHVLGAFTKLEIEWNDVGNWWHCHLHVLAHGYYWPQSELQAKWSRLNKDCAFVHIEACDESAKIELAKYIIKVKANPSIPWGELTEALRNVHEFSFSGDFADQPPIDAQQRPAGKYIFFGNLTSFYNRVMECQWDIILYATFLHLKEHSWRFRPDDQWMFGYLTDHFNSYIDNHPRCLIDF